MLKFYFLVVDDRKSLLVWKAFFLISKLSQFLIKKGTIWIRQILGISPPYFWTFRSPELKIWVWCTSHEASTKLSILNFVGAKMKPCGLKSSYPTADHVHFQLKFVIIRTRVSAQEEGG